MTTNEPPNQLKWSIRARSGVDSGQWDWGIKGIATILVVADMMFLNDMTLII